MTEVLTSRHFPFAFVSGTDPTELGAIAGATIIGKPVTETELGRLLSSANQS